MKFKINYHITVLFLIVFLIGAFGITWGISNLSIPPVDSDEYIKLSYHPDEPFCMKGGVDFATSSSEINNLFFCWGGMGEFAVSSFIAKFFFFFNISKNEIISKYGHLFILSGRIFSLLCGLLSSIIIYYSGANIFSKNTGFFAALIFVVSPAFIENSCVFRPDMPSFLGMTFCLFSMFMYQNDKNGFLCLLGGVGAGFAGAFKLTNLMIAVVFAPVFLQTLLINKIKAVKHILVFILGLLTTFIIISYLSFIYPDKAITFLSAWKNLKDGIDIPVLYNNKLLYNGFFVLSFALGLATVSFGYLGIIYSVLKKNSVFLPLFIGAFFFFITIGKINSISVRYTLPFSLFLFLPISYFIFDICKKNQLLKVILLTLIFLITFLSAFNRLYLRYNKDTRQIASEWIDEKIKKGEKLSYFSFLSWHLHPWTEHYPLMFFDKKYKSKWNLKNLSDISTDYWVFTYYDIEQIKRLKSKHPFPNEAIFILGILQGMTKDGIKWEKVADFQTKLPFPSLGFFRKFEPQDFNYVSPGFVIYKKVDSF